MISCIKENIASEKTIQSLGGIFERQEYDAKKDITLNLYWINVSESLEKYKDVYEQYVLNLNDLKIKK